MPERPAAGRAVVTRRAVTDIVRTAVLGSYGVVGFATKGPWEYIVRKLGLGEPGIHVTLDELRVDVHLRVAYGLPVAEVARQVDSAIRYALQRDLGRGPGQLTIHVDGLVQHVGRPPDATDAPEAADGGVVPPGPATAPADEASVRHEAGATDEPAPDGAPPDEPGATR